MHKSFKLKSKIGFKKDKGLYTFVFNINLNTIIAKKN